MRLQPIALTAALALLADQASGQSASKPAAPAPNLCFRQADIENSVQASRSHLNIKIRDGRYFQIQTNGTCFISPGLDPYVLKVRGPDMVCHPIDMDLSATSSGVRMPCIVDKIVPMTKAQVLALPKREQP
jgi:hypothetical protein